MELKIKKSKDNKWGFVETFKVWRYLNPVGYVEAVVGVSYDGKFTKPYVFRGEEFIPLQEINEEMGIEKYIKAKKPFYSLLTDGFVAKVRVYINFETGEYIEDKSSYVVYSVVGSKDEKVAFTKRLREVPSKVDDCMKKLMKELSSNAENREKFLSSRL